MSNTENEFNYYEKKFDSVPTLEQLKGLSFKAKGFLFDLDGTLINSEPLHAQAMIYLLNEDEQEAKAKKNITEAKLKEIEKQVTGKSDPEVLKIIQNLGLIDPQSDINKLVKRKNEILLELLVKKVHENDDKINLYLKPQITELLTELKSNNFSLGLVTASEDFFAHKALEVFNLKRFFNFILTRQSTLSTKPSPEPYLLGHKKLNLPKEEILIFEDSQTGMLSAEKSQIKFIQANWYRGIESIQDIQKIISQS